MGTAVRPRGRGTIDCRDRVRRRPLRVFERETVLEQSRRNHATALQNQLGFRAHEDGANLEHPLVRRQAERDAARLAEHPHELRVRQGIWRRDVHGAVDVVAIDQPPNRRDEVLVVNPRHELPAVAGAAAEAVARQAEERVEHASRVRTQRHRRPQRNLSGPSVTASSKARSHARATSMLNRQELGAFDSWPPRMPECSSFGLSYRCA